MYQKKPDHISKINTILGKLSSDDLVKELRKFVKCCRPNRMAGGDGAKTAADYLVERIREIDQEKQGLLTIDEFTPDIASAKAIYQNDFEERIKGKFPAGSETYIKWEGFTQSMLSLADELKNTKGRNIIWQKLGKRFPNRIMMIGAHFDTIAYNKKTLIVDREALQPGADNNATGVALLLSLVKFLSEMDIENTVQVAFLDFQEIGMLGAKAMVDKYKEQWRSESVNFEGFVNVLMLGNDTKKYDLEKKFGNMRAYIRSSKEAGSELDEALAQKIIKWQKNFSYTTSFDLVKNSNDSSDQLRFWEQGLPAVMFGQNWENDFNQERIHTANDFVETLNFKTYHQSFSILAGGLFAWAMNIEK